MSIEEELQVKDRMALWALERSQLRIKHLEYRAIHADPQDFDELADEIEAEKIRCEELGQKRAYWFGKLAWEQSKNIFKHADDHKTV